TRKLTATEAKEFTSTWQQLLPHLKRRITISKEGVGSTAVSPLMVPGVSAADAIIPSFNERVRPPNSMVPQPEDTTPAQSIKATSYTQSSSQPAKRKRADSNSKIPVLSTTSTILSAEDKENPETTHLLKRTRTGMPTKSALASASASTSSSVRKPLKPSISLGGKENEPDAAPQDVRRKKTRNSQSVPQNVLRENKNIINGVLPDKKKEKDNGTTTIDRPVLGARTNQSNLPTSRSSTMAPNTITVPAQTARQQPRRAQIVLPTEENLQPSVARKDGHMIKKSDNLGKSVTAIKGSSTASTSKSSNAKPRIEVFRDTASPTVEQSPSGQVKHKKETDIRDQLLYSRSKIPLVTADKPTASPSSHNATPPSLTRTPTTQTRSASHVLQLQCIDLDAFSVDARAKSSPSATPTSRVVERRDADGKIILEIPGSEEDYETPIEDPRADDASGSTSDLFVCSSQTQHEVQPSQEDDFEEADPDDLIETFPAPDFLHELEDCDDESNNIHDVLTQPQTQEQEQEQRQEKDQGQKQVHVDKNRATASVAAIRKNVESSAMKDGVWCFEQPERPIERVICGRKGRWMAIESQNDLDFWSLDDRADSNPKWRLAFSWPKDTAKTWVVFSEQDSHAIVMNSQPSSSSSLTLIELHGQHHTSRLPVDWGGLLVEDSCAAWLTDVTSNVGAENDSGLDGNLMLLLGCTSEPGCIITLSVPKDGCLPQNTTIQATSFNTPRISSTITSLQLVDNCDGLCLATFADKLVLWDLSMMSEGPLSIVDVPGSKLPSVNDPSFHVLQASVPQELYDEFADVINAGLLTHRDWPIYAVFEARSRSERTERMTAVLMNDQIEIVQQYQDIGIGSAFASSDLLLVESEACSSDEKSLTLWDLVKADKLATLTVKPHDVGPVPLDRSQALCLEAYPTATMKHGSEGEQQPVRKLSLASTLTSGSTLSSPPVDMTVFSQSSSDNNEEGNSRPSGVAATPIIKGNAKDVMNESSRVGQWMEDTHAASSAAVCSVSSKLETSFCLHPKQPWLVVTCTSPSGGSHYVPMVHIIDVSTFLQECNP
ncbi:hypothetical protein BGW41_005796, partial [Actinomortierella wolfii]